MFAQLGNHIFEGLKTPSMLNEANSMRYGRVALVNDKDVLQYNGEQLDEIKIAVQYTVDFCQPHVEIEALRKSMRDAEVLPLIMGNGTIVGKFVITDLDVTNQRYLPGGQLESASINIDLLEKVGGAPVSSQGIAIAQNISSVPSPVAEVPATPVVSPANSVTKNIGEAKNNVNAIKKIEATIKEKTSSYKHFVRQIRQLASDVKQNYQTARTKVSATGKIANRAKELTASLDNAIHYAEKLETLDDTADISVMKLGVEQLSQSVNKVTIHATPVISFSATKEGGK